MRDHKQATQVAVLGGGLLGCCIALELAQHGLNVTLVEQDQRLMNRASLRNEGKVHLGLTYANDPTMETGRLQLRGALTFSRLLSRWTGCRAEDLGISRGFHYLVANDSLLTVDDLASYYDRLNAIYLNFIKRDQELEYLQTRPEVLAEPLRNGDLARHYRLEHFQAGFSTPEKALDPAKLATVVRSAVKRNSNIHTLYRTKVKQVSRDDLLEIRYAIGDTEGALYAEQVVNATWVNRLAIDSDFGLQIQPGWVHRLKFRVVTRLPDTNAYAPSATMALGRYGDVVVRPDATAYLSWYPTVMRGWSHELAPPHEWDGACSHSPHYSFDNELIAEEVINSIAAWYPLMDAARCIKVDAGAIFAYGVTDVDDSNSGLHQRADVGVVSQDGYHSVNPGKLTTAPLMAILAAKKILNKPVIGLGPISCLVD